MRLTTSGDARDGLNLVVSGVAFAGLALAYRNVLVGVLPTLYVGGIHLLFGGPVALYFTPLVVYVIVVAYLRRAELRRVGSMIAADLRHKPK